MVAHLPPYRTACPEAVCAGKELIFWCDAISMKNALRTKEQIGRVH